MEKETAPFTVRTLWSQTSKSKKSHKNKKATWKASRPPTRSNVRPSIALSCNLLSCCQLCSIEFEMVLSSLRSAMQKHLMLKCLACLPELAFSFSSSFMELWLPQQTARHTVAVLHSGRPSLFKFQNEKSIEKARDPVVATNTDDIKRRPTS